MRDIRMAKDGNTIYLTATAENNEEQKKVVEMIKLLAEAFFLNTELKAEDLIGAKNVEKVLPEPLPGSEKIELEKAKISTLKSVEKTNEAEKSKEEDIQQKMKEQKEQEYVDIQKKIDANVCPICGKELAAGKFGKYCKNCKFQTKVYGVTVSPEMVHDLLRKQQTEIHTFKSRNGDFNGRLIMNQDHEMVFRSEN